MFKFRFNILFVVRITKKIPGYVASWTPCITQMNDQYLVETLCEIRIFLCICHVLKAVRQIEFRWVEFRVEFIACITVV